MCGEPMAPADRITSRAAWTRSTAPPRENSTRVVRLLPRDGRRRVRQNDGWHHGETTCNELVYIGGGLDTDGAPAS
jgi:hypothetical protein